MDTAPPTQAPDDNSHHGRDVGLGAGGVVSLLLATVVLAALAIIAVVLGRSGPAAALLDDGVATKDGGIPAGVTVFDGRYPAVANLDPALLQALRTAASRAANDGVEFTVNSGWRSPAYQQQLFTEAVAEYGSPAEAARWVATPDTSVHVSGEAVDVGPPEAAAWLSTHGVTYGLCQTYDNEPWHYELRSGAADRGCPTRFADPSQDPRMRR